MAVADGQDRQIPRTPMGCADYLCMVLATIVFVFLCIALVGIPLCFVWENIDQHERAVVFRNGRVNRDDPAKGPGRIFVWPFVDRVEKVSMRVVSLNVPPQEILTKDSVTVAVDAVVFYYVYNPTQAVLEVENYQRATYLLALSTLRAVLGSRELREVLSDRDTLASEIALILDKATDPWGIKVNRVEMKDVKLPQQLQRAMAAEAEATREAKAKVIGAQGEMNAAVALREASETIAKSPGAMQLRYLQTLTVIAAEKSDTYVFPVPLELMKKYM